MTEINTQIIKAIIWDLDGTILDSPRLMRILIDELAETFSLERPSDETLAKNFHGSLSETLGAILGVANEDDLARILETFLVNQEHHYETIEAHLLSDAVALMTHASNHGLKQVIVTNREHTGRGAASPRMIAKHAPLNEHIHKVICGDDFALFRKPDPRIVEKILHEWSILPSEVIVIGDQFVDAQLAINLDTKAIIVSRESDRLVNDYHLPSGWQDSVTLVRSLHDVEIVK